jgi:hypothetical protein
MLNADGNNKWPTSRNPDTVTVGGVNMVQEWKDRINSDDIALVTVNGDPNNYGRVSFYDSSINDDFFTSNYNSGTRPLLRFMYTPNNTTRYVIEIPCGNPVGGLPGLPEVAWGAMTGNSKANKATVEPGGHIQWEHQVWDSGSVGNQDTPVISGDVYWGGGTTGPVPAADRVGAASYPTDVQPDKSYSRSFSTGKANGYDRFYDFDVPNNAQAGDKYCQYVNWNHTSSNDNSSGNPGGDCVTVVEWGAMTGDTSASNGTVKPGSTVTWTNTVWDDGSVGPDDTPTISGDVMWGAGTSGPIPTAYRAGGGTPLDYSLLPLKVQDPSIGGGSVSYSRSFSKGKANGVTKKFAFPIPANALDGDRYCVFINWDHTSSDDNSGGRSSGACVTVGVPHLQCQAVQVTPTDVDPLTPVKIIATASYSNFTPSDLKFTATTGVRSVDSPGGTANPQTISYGLVPFGHWTGNVSVTATDSFDGQPVAGTATCPLTIDSGYLPYLSVYGGDAMAGVSPKQVSGQVSTCATDAGAGFESWNKDSASDYSGAGSEIAVAALGDKSYHFVSNLGAANPTRITFANANANIGAADYGGAFGTSGAYGLPNGCDFIGSASTTNPPSNTFGTKTLAADGHAEVYVVKNSDVYISGDITYAPYSSVGQIPSFKLVVIGGNIYIGSGVHNLHGLYVAEPDSSGNGGTIYTCAGAAGLPYKFSDANYYPGEYNLCNSQLTIYGSFVAKHIDFLRSHGTLGAASMSDDYNSGTPAEKFIYSPEMWLPNGTDGGSFQPDTFQGLPPVL